MARNFDDIKLLEDAIRGALGVYPENLPMSHHTEHNKTGPSPAGSSPAGITSPFGKRDLGGRESFHQGTDIGLPEGSPVYAIDGGTVIHAGWQNANNTKAGGGLYIKISHANHKDSFYMHLSKLTVAVKDMVRIGQLIGYSGKTGHVVGRTGEHLHLEIHQNGSARAATGDEIRMATSGKGK